MRWLSPILLRLLSCASGVSASSRRRSRSRPNRASRRGLPPTTSPPTTTTAGCFSPSPLADWGRTPRLDPGLPGEGEEFTVVREQRGSCIELATLLAEGPRDDKTRRSGLRRAEHASGHPPEDVLSPPCGPDRVGTRTVDRRPDD